MTGPLQVLVLGLNYAPESTGIAPYTTGTARFLADAGHDVHVVTGLPHYPQWEVAEGHPRRRSSGRDGAVRLTRVPHPVPRRPSGRSRIAMEAVFAARAAVTRVRRPDVVLAVSPALLGVAAALRWRAPGRTAVGVVVQDLYSRAVVEAGLLSGREARATAALERRLLRGADGVAAIHETFRSSLVRLGVDAGRITTIRNWTHVGRATGDPAALRRAHGWRADEVVALHAGNMGAKQGLENVVEAARLAHARRLPVRFVLLGDGHQRPALAALAGDLPTLQFLAPLPDGEFETALQAADVLVLNERPGIAEMCVPSKLTSYFAAGRPVVAASSPHSAGSAEVAASGAGVQVAPGDPAVLLQAVLDISGDRAVASASGLRGQAFARDVLHERAARAAYVDWVERLAGRPPQPVRPRAAEPAAVGEPA
ncbi:glycosyltransferase involved in cell wall biosynthesis [Geodermatophilus normandii]|uniref:Glycosyltransferase involved in cell wall biosynthesis n=1 Tax=Geodermatophilus normandii TaxID=1137989 RepID=A0A317QFY6_9ACTN|nr:glycosyltransferase family 4 protein [Geodermatophilus normandii]PWW21893.1 glycosyltransferase involved in cell wall biosynthesis [Geodermatophilus normandii]